MSFGPRPRDLVSKIMDFEGNAFPTLVVESATTTESFAELKGFLRLWLCEHTDVQMVIGAKLFPLQKTNERRLVVLFRKRDDSDFAEAEFLLNFGSSTATRVDAGGPTTIEIPIREVLFHGSSRDLAGYPVDDPILLDLNEMAAFLLDLPGLIP